MCRRDARHLDLVPRSEGARRRGLHAARPARSTPCSARTARASRPSSRRSPASTRSMPGTIAVAGAAPHVHRHRRRAERRHRHRLSRGQPLREPQRRRERHARQRGARAVRHRLAGDARRAPHSSCASSDSTSTRARRSRSHSLAVQQLVAISRAVVVDCRVLVLDEPTSSLDRSEVEQLFAVMRAPARPRRRHPLRLALPRPDLRDLRPHDVLRNGRLEGEYPVGRARPAAADLARCSAASSPSSTRSGARPSAPSTAPASRCSGCSRSASKGIDRAGRPRRLSTARWSDSPACSARAAPSSRA